MAIAIASVLTPGNAAGNSEMSKVRQIEADFTEAEKNREIAELLLIGDESAAGKEYDRAIEAYEHVFLLEPNHVKASAKIDAVKKELLREGKSEAGVVEKVYAGEIQERVRRYMTELRGDLEAERIGRAKFTLRKILLLDPLNQEAQRIYESLEKKRV